MGTMPDPDQIPPELDDFPSEVQQAFDVYHRLPDRWDGMSGTYLGKDFSALDVMFELFQVYDRRTALDFISLIDVIRQGLFMAKQKEKEETKKHGSK